MATKFIVFCASALLVQAVAGHIVPLNWPVLGGGSAAASSAASAAASRNAAAASAAAAAAARGGRGGSAAASSSASAAAARNAAAASAAASSAAGAWGGAASSASASAAAAARAASAGYAGSALLNLADYNIVYSEPLLVTSTSPLYPSGLYVSSELGLQGPLHVSGTMPFLSAVSFEDSLASDGSGIATCGCGSDTIGIFQEA